MAKQIKKITIVGMGALGIMYGAHIRDNSADADLDYVMDSGRAEKYKDTVYSVNGRDYQFPITKDADASPADLLVVAVKYTGLFDALDVMEKCVGPDTIILSVMNGISSEKILAERFPDAHVIYCVVQGMDCMKIGDVVTYSVMGNVHIGSTGADQESVNAVRDFLEEVKMPYVYEEDILYRMWSKFMLNVGINQTCMAYGIGYGGALEAGEANRVLIAAFREAIAVANAEGINLTDRTVNDYIAILKTLNPKACPSMAQDRINKKPSEVEMFAGTIIELGRKHQIYVPTNEFLYERIREIEKEYVDAGFG